MKNPKKPAFPYKAFDQLGLTKREYFAGLAMKGLMSVFSNKSMATIYYENALKKGLTLTEYITAISIEHSDELLKQLGDGN